MARSVTQGGPHFPNYGGLVVGLPWKNIACNWYTPLYLSLKFLFPQVPDDDAGGQEPSSPKKDAEYEWKPPVSNTKLVSDSN